MADRDPAFHRLPSQTPSISWPTWHRTTTAAGSSRARPSTSACSRSRWRRSWRRSPRASRRAASRCRPTPSPRSSGSTATPASPRTSRRTRPTSARASRGSSTATPDGPYRTPSMATAAYFHLQPGNDYVGGGMWHGDEARSSTRSGRPSSMTSERVRAALEDPGFLAAFGPVTSHETLKRVPPGFPPITRLPTGRATRTSCSGGGWGTTRCARPSCRTILAEAFARATPVFRFLSTLDG